PGPVVEQAPPKEPTLPQSTDRLALKQAPMDRGEPIDAAAFSAAFKRQARTSLIPCLQAAEGATHSLVLSAQLQKSGRLRHIRPVGREDLPECATAAMEAMEFASLISLMETESQFVQWRLDF